MITGKEKIFSGKEVSDEERISLAGNLLGAHIKRATDIPNTPITEAIRKGLSNFVTDMVVETPINLTKDSVWLAEKGARILVEGAIKSYSTILNTNSPNQATIDNIVKGITLPVNVLNDAMQIYNQAGRWLTIEQVKNIVSRFFSDKIDKGEITIPKIEDPGQSTTTFDLKDTINKKFDPTKEPKLSDHIQEAVSMKEFIEYTKGKSLKELQHEIDGGQASDSSAGGPANKYRYVIDPANPNRVIDMRHFLVIGGKEYFGMGLGVEILQSIGDSTSAWHPQDFFSNDLGAQFFKMNFNPNPNISFSMQLKDYFDWWANQQNK